MLDKMKHDGLAAVAPKEEAYVEYNADLSERVKDTVWVTGGCNSWYIDKTGTPNLYPYCPTKYLKDMVNPDFAEYRLMETVINDIEVDTAVAA